MNLTQDANTAAPAQQSAPTAVTAHQAMRQGCDAELAAMSQRIADQQVIAEIESNCPAYVQGGDKWLDTRFMTDPREHSGEVLDMNAEVLGYAARRGITIAHLLQPYLVRICTQMRQEQQRQQPTV
jgi:hypothetical protein